MSTEGQAYTAMPPPGGPPMMAKEGPMQDKVGGQSIAQNNFVPSYGQQQQQQSAVQSAYDTQPAQPGYGQASAYASPPYAPPTMQQQQPAYGQPPPQQQYAQPPGGYPQQPQPQQYGSAPPAGYPPQQPYGAPPAAYPAQQQYGTAPPQQQYAPQQYGTAPAPQQSYGQPPAPMYPGQYGTQPQPQQYGAPPVAQPVYGQPPAPGYGQPQYAQPVNAQFGVAPQQPYMAAPQPMVQVLPSNPNPINQGTTHGKKHGDTITFNDLMFLGVARAGAARLTEIRVWSQYFVEGIQCIWDIGGQRVEGPVHRGRETPGVMQSMVFAPTETVLGIEGRGGSWIDQLTILTTHKKQTFGTSNGGLPFSTVVPQGCRVVCFHGGTGNHIHCLGLNYQLMMQQPLQGGTFGQQLGQMFNPATYSSAFR